MKQLRIASLFLALLMVLALSGCDKKWSVDFTFVSDIDDWNVFDWYPPYTCTLGPAGMLIQGCWVEGPNEFRGDFTATFVFELDTDAGNSIGHLRMNVGDGQNGDRVNVIEVYMQNIGAINEKCEVIMRGASLEDTVTTFLGTPGLNRTGVNTLRIRRTGDNIAITLNTSTALANFDMSDYASPYAVDFFIPSMYAYTSTGGYLRFKMVSVQYAGTMLPHVY